MQRSYQKIIHIGIILFCLIEEKNLTSATISDLQSTLEAVRLHSQKSSTKQSPRIDNVISCADTCLYILTQGMSQGTQEQKPASQSCTCSLEPALAGELPQKVCAALRNLSKSRIRPLPFQNTLLFFGPPGTGKTTIAHEIAKKTGATFHSYSGANIVTKWQGSGAAGVQEIFKSVQNDLDQGKLVVLFVDEIDAIARDRRAVSGEHRDHTDALNQFLVRICDYKDNPHILIIFATNMIDLLDSAIRSRVDAIEIPTPNEEMCKNLFLHYLSKYKHNLEQSIPFLARRAADARLSCRDIENIVKNAYSASQWEGAEHITEDYILREIAPKEQARIREQNEQQQILEDVQIARDIAHKQLESLEKKDHRIEMQLELLELQIEWYHRQLNIKQEQEQKNKNRKKWFFKKINSDN